MLLNQNGRKLLEASTSPKLLSLIRSGIVFLWLIPESSLTLRKGEQLSCESRPRSPLPVPLEDGWVEFTRADIGDRRREGGRKGPLRTRPWTGTGSSTSPV